MVAGYGSSPVWVWLIGLTAIAGAVAQFVISILRPKATAAAWDEQVTASHRASLQFGYWTALTAFVVLFAMTRTDHVSPELAFYLLAPVLGAAPSLWMVGASLAGRAG
jgi:hypothetical protein